MFIIIVALATVAAAKRITHRGTRPAEYHEPATHYETHHDDYSKKNDHSDDYKPVVAHVHYEDKHHSTDYDHTPVTHAEVHHKSTYDNHHNDEYKPAVHRIDDVHHSVDYHTAPAVYDEKPTYSAHKSYDYVNRIISYLNLNIVVNIISFRLLDRTTFRMLSRMSHLTTITPMNKPATTRVTSLVRTASCCPTAALKSLPTSLITTGTVLTSNTKESLNFTSTPKQPTKFLSTLQRKKVMKKLTMLQLIKNPLPTAKNTIDRLYNL